MAEAMRAHQAALDAAPNDADRCRALLGLAAVKRVTDELDGAFADLEQAEALATRLGLTGELARLHFLRGNLYFPRGQIERCLAEHQRSLELARAGGSAELEAQAQGGLGDAEYVRGRMLSAGRHFRACIELCRQHGFGRIEVASLPMAASDRALRRRVRARAGRGDRSGRGRGSGRSSARRDDRVSHRIPVPGGVRRLGRGAHERGTRDRSGPPARGPALRGRRALASSRPSRARAGGAPPLPAW